MDKLKKAITDLFAKGTIDLSELTLSDIDDLSKALSMIKEEGFFDESGKFRKPKKPKENVLDYSKFNKPAPKSGDGAPTLDYGKMKRNYAEMESKAPTIDYKNLNNEPKPKQKVIQTKDLHTTLMNQRKTNPKE